MALITRGILGGGSGSVGPVTLQKQFGIDTIRKKPKPQYPGTPAQLQNQVLFNLSNKYTKSAYPQLIVPFWKVFPPYMSASNYFFRKVFSYLKLNGQITSDFNFIEGSILPDILPAFELTIDLENHYSISFMEDWPDYGCETYLTFCLFGIDNGEVYVDPTLRVGDEEHYNNIDWPLNLVLDDFNVGVIIENRSTKPYSYFTQNLYYAGT